jgi:Fe-S cluster biogenesis protein NfuA
MTNVAPSGQLEAIRRFIDDKISPGVNSHGGEVLIHSLETNILTLGLSGACGSCGIVAYTSESIANYILEEFPDLDDVIVTD